MMTGKRRRSAWFKSILIFLFFALPQLSYSSEQTQIPWKAKVALEVQTGMTAMLFANQYFETLNFRNCARWFCSAGSVMGFFASVALPYWYRDRFLATPTITFNFLAMVMLVAWDISYWNSETRHRSEYYDGYQQAAALYLASVAWTAAYLFYLRDQRLRDHG